MSSTKDLLKLAKKALADYDWDEAIELSRMVLKKDRSNYFAKVFLGKANEGLGNYSEAKNEYEDAIKLDEHNVIAWKGLFVTFKTANDVTSFVTYDEYFQLCGQYAQLLLSLQLSLIDLISDIKAFRKKYPACEESFLKHIRPGYAMSELIGRHIFSDKEALEKLLRLLLDKEQQEASKLISRARMKISVNDNDYHLKVNSSAWSVYENSEVDGVYNQLVNIVDDDEKRGNLESQWLEYRCKILKSMPKDLKTDFYYLVKKMVVDMVLVKHNSLLVWKLYFEWSDYQDLGAFDLEICSEFVQKFPTDPLAMIIYAWICSEFSPYDSQKFYEKTLKLNEHDKKALPSSLEEATDDDTVGVLEEITQKDNDLSADGFSETSVVGTLQENIKQCKQSILANRIVSHYYISQKEYEKVLPFIRTGASCVATATRDFGALLHNSKNDFTLLYGTAYTYFEAPKNHGTALSLFDKVLFEDPKNIKAKMGKGLIFIQRENWDEACRLLGDAVKEFPENYEVLSNYGWCLLHLGEPDNAIEIFSTVLESSPLDDPNLLDFRALNYWRIASCFLSKAESTESEDLLDSAYRNLVKALKVSNEFVPAYSSLGEIYRKYYKDETRAFKCFFKALSLDPGDIRAASYLSEKYCESGNWESAAIICERIIKLGKVKSSLLSLNWPYRILGISFLERRKPAGSIEWLQSSLRIDPSDVQSWIALGQAYLGCGRVEASIKVFERVLELNENEKFGLYFLAQAYSSIGEFEKSLSTFDQLISLYPTEECFLVSEVVTIVEFAGELFKLGFLVKSASVSAKSMSKIEHVICNISNKIQSIWISLSKALKICVLVQSEIHRLPLPSLLNIFDSCAQILSVDSMFSSDNISLDGLLTDETNDNLTVSLGLLILSAKCALFIHNPDSMPKTNSAALWYNLGCAELFAYFSSKKICFRDTAIECLKKSIKFQSNSADTWVGLGIATMDVNFRVSQHCFIKSLALNPKELSSWNYLGMLALQCNDLELANQLFLKLQSLAPQDSSSWLGLALTLEKEGEISESNQMFAHAFVLSNGTSNTAQILHAKSVLSRRLGKAGSERDICAQEEFSNTAIGLDQYLKRSPNDIYALQLSILNLERLHDFKSAHLVAKNLSTLLEKRFEQNQDEKELFNFAIINSQFARLNLGMVNFAEAIEKAELSLAFLEDELCVGSPIAMRAYISNHVVLALSHLFNGDVENALEHSKVLLEISKDSSNIALLIFRVLFAIDSEDASEIGIQELLEYVASHGNNLQVTLTLATFFIIKNRPLELEELAKQLRGLSLSEMLHDNHKDVPAVLEQINKIHGSDNRRTIFEWQKTAFLFPNNNNAWNSLSPEIMKRISENESSKVNSLQLSSRYCQLGQLTKIQKGLFLCPWNEKGIRALHNCF